MYSINSSRDLFTASSTAFSLRFCSSIIAALTVSCLWEEENSHGNMHYDKICVHFIPTKNPLLMVWAHSVQNVSLHRTKNSKNILRSVRFHRMHFSKLSERERNGMSHLLQGAPDRLQWLPHQPFTWCLHDWLPSCTLHYPHKTSNLCLFFQEHPNAVAVLFTFNFPIIQ